MALDPGAVGEVVVDLDDGWSVGRADSAGSASASSGAQSSGAQSSGAQSSGAQSSGAESGDPVQRGVTLPHSVAPLSWGSWDPASWEHRWRYRRTFTVPELPVGADMGGLWVLEFDGVASAVAVTVNGRSVGSHLGGYLACRFDVTDAVRTGPNELSVEVDSRFTVDAPPNAVDADSTAIDFWQPGGIYRSVRLRRVPTARIADVVVTTFDILEPHRRLEVTVSVTGPVRAGSAVVVELLDRTGELVHAADEQPLPTDGVGGEVIFELADLPALELWDIDHPALYTVRATMAVDGSPAHSRSIRTGFREAVFRPDGFFLNGRRLSLRGANRHQLFPWAGFAMGDRVQRRDAQVLRDELNCVMVRCSHYPQSPAFLDACDELGLLVWEEAPGWQHIGGAQWQDRACRDVAEMILRDRHRPSIVVWGSRLNEMPDNRELWSRTEAIAKRLDPTRQTSGTIHGVNHDTDDFQQDVFSYDDYTTTEVDGDRQPVLLPPRGPWPYLIAEGVSQRSSPTLHYRRTDPSVVSQHQALDYAVALDAVAADERYTGLLAWVGFDYQTGYPGYLGVKRGGLADVFRIPKAGAALFRSQVEPDVRAVVEPAFAWGSGPGATVGPGPGAVVCGNVDRLEVFLDGASHSVVEPDRVRFPHLEYPPFFVDLPEEGPLPELRLDGYRGDRLVISERFSGDPSQDGLLLAADDDELIADGRDATRVVVGVVDQFGHLRAHSGGLVGLSVSGPVALVGDNPFDIGGLGGVGAIWLRSRSGASGPASLQATLGDWAAQIRLTVRAPTGASA